MKKKLIAGLMIACMVIGFTTTNIHATTEKEEVVVDGNGEEVIYYTPNTDITEDDLAFIRKYKETNNSPLAQLFPMKPVEDSILQYEARNSDMGFYLSIDAPKSVSTSDMCWDVIKGHYTPVIALECDVTDSYALSRGYNTMTKLIYNINGYFYHLDAYGMTIGDPSELEPIEYESFWKDRITNWKGDGYWSFGGEQVILHEPQAMVVHLTTEGEVLKEEVVKTGDLLAGLIFRESGSSLEKFSGLKDMGFDYIENKEGQNISLSGKAITRSFYTEEFEGYTPISGDMLDIDVLSTGKITFYYEKNTPSISTLETDTKGRAALSVKYIDEEGVELDTAKMPDIIPGRYSVEPRLFEGYSTDDTTQEVVLNENEEKEVVFYYKKKSPIAPVAVTGTSGMAVLLFAFNRKGIVIKRKNEDGTTIQLFKTRLKGTTLDVTEALKLAEGDTLEITILKHIARKKGGQDIRIKGTYEGRIIDEIITIPTQINKEFKIEI